jgi:hypothetical protein
LPKAIIAEELGLEGGEFHFGVFEDFTTGAYSSNRTVDKDEL